MPRKKAPARKGAVKTPRARRTQAGLKGTPGHPTVLTEAVQKKLMDAVKVGNYIETAARYAGVSRSATFNWIRRGRNEQARIESERQRVEAQRSEGLEDADLDLEQLEVRESEALFVTFVDALDQAEAEAEVYAVTVLRTSMNSPDHNVRVRSATAYLERKHPGRWSRAQRTEIEVGGTGTPIEVSVVDDQTRRATSIIEVLQAADAFGIARANLAGDALLDGDEDLEDPDE